MKLSLKQIRLLYILSLAGYSLLSWVLMLRDSKAFIAIPSFYPQLDPTIFRLQVWALAHHLNSIPTLLYISTIALAYFAYFKLLSLLKKQPQPIFRKSLFRLIIVSLFLLLLSYPVLSSDLFDYTLLNRVIAVYKANPWTTPANTFPKDPFIILGQWQNITSVYGPVYHLVTLPATLIAGSDLFANIIGLRLIAISFYFICLLLIKKLSVSLKLTNPNWVVAAFAFNPAILIEFIGSAHNDIFMVVFMLASLLALTRRQYLLSGVLLGLGFHVKLFAIALLPFILSYLVYQKRFKELIRLIFGTLTSVSIGLLIMGPESVISYLAVSQYKFSLSLNSLPKLFPNLPHYVFNLPFIAISLFFVFFKKTSSIQSLITKYSLLTLVYLLFVVSLYWPWYIIWLFPFTLFTKSSNLIKAGLALTLTSMLHYGVLMISHRFNYELFIWTVLIYGTIMSAPAFYLYRYLKQAREK